jgi:uncharacterized membrane protein
MRSTKQSIEVDVPVDVAFERWSRFTELPRFMLGVQEVEPLDDGRLRWVGEFCGERLEWFAEVTERTPDRALAWESEGGPIRAGRVTFEASGDESTKVTLWMQHNPETIAEALGDKLLTDPDEVRADLECFKEIVEEEQVGAAT